MTRLYVYLFATAPLTGAERRAHRRREKAVRYGFGGRALAGHERATFPTLEAAFRARFPELRAVAITHRWGGPIAFALDFLPAVGRTGRCAPRLAPPRRAG